MKNLPELPHTTYNGYADGREPLYTAEQMRDYALRAQPSPAPAAQTAQDFDAWQKNPYTIVLQKSIADDYVPRSAAPPTQAIAGGADIGRLLETLAFAESHRQQSDFRSMHIDLGEAFETAGKLRALKTAAPQGEKQ